MYFELGRAALIKRFFGIVLLSSGLPVFAQDPFCHKFLETVGPGGLGPKNIANSFGNFSADNSSLERALKMAKAFVAFEGTESIGLLLRGGDRNGKDSLSGECDP